MSSHLPESGVTHEELQRQCLEGWDSLPDALQLRIHRALSWIGRAEREADDDDAAFIFYWIAFNAVYAEDKSGGLNGRRSVELSGVFRQDRRAG